MDINKRGCILKRAVGVNAHRYAQFGCILYKTAEAQPNGRNVMALHIHNIVEIIFIKCIYFPNIQNHILGLIYSQ